MKFKVTERKRSITAIWLLAYVILATAGWVTGVARADDATDPQQRVKELHEMLAGLGTQVGGFSDLQKQQIAALETSMTARLNANPGMSEQQLGQELFAGVNKILTPAQMKRLDDTRAQNSDHVASAMNEYHLNNVAINLISYAAAHAGALPPDLGTLTSTKLDPKMFLAANSKTVIPANFKTLSPAQQAEWINKHTDFVYVGAGKDVSKLEVVVAYLRPAAAPRGNQFVLLGGQVIAENPAVSQKIIGELTEGKNPPPSLDVSAAGPAPRAQPDADPQHAQHMIQGIHEQLGSMGKAVGGLSDDQKSKLADLESSLAAKIKADPHATPATLRDDVLGGFRLILTADQQKTFDTAIAESNRRVGSMRDSARLKHIGMALMLYADRHKGTLPADQGTLTQVINGGETFLAGASKTKVPDGFAQLAPAARTDWVNKNSDFIYLAGGKQVSKLPSGTVLAYIKPEAATIGNAFLLSDGSVFQEDADTSEKIITELTAGTNPPPSLDTKPHVPATPQG